MKFITIIKVHLRFGDEKMIEVLTVVSKLAVKALFGTTFIKESISVILLQKRRLAVRDLILVLSFK